MSQISSILKRYHNRMIAKRLIPARSGEYALIPEERHPALKTCLAELGLRRLFSHQTEMFTRLPGPPAEKTRSSPPELLAANRGVDVG